MGVYIKGLEMPKYESEEVIIRVLPNGNVRDEHNILLDCTAIDVPAPFGRLGDLDKLYYWFGSSSEASMHPQNTVLMMPTIIEAEDE
jgi:hypothetical protein